MSAELDGTLRSLADPVRRGVMQRLAHGPATAGQLGALFSISRPAVSRHLRVLRDAHLISATANGRHLWYQAEREPLLGLADWLTDLLKRVTDAPPLRGPHYDNQEEAK